MMFLYTLLLQTCLFFLVFCKEGKIAFNLSNMFRLRQKSSINMMKERSCGTDEFCVLSTLAKSLLQYPRSLKNSNPPEFF